MVLNKQLFGFEVDISPTPIYLTVLNYSAPGDLNLRKVTASLYNADRFGFMPIEINLP